MKTDTYNGWTNRETWLVNVWSHDEIRALLFQFICGNVRELDGYWNDDGSFDIPAWEADCEAGGISGNLYPSDSGEWFFYAGN